MDQERMREEGSPPRDASQTRPLRVRPDHPQPAGANEQNWTAEQKLCRVNKMLEELQENVQKPWGPKAREEFLAALGTILGLTKGVAHQGDATGTRPETQEIRDMFAKIDKRLERIEKTRKHGDGSGPGTCPGTGSGRAVGGGGQAKPLWSEVAGPGRHT